MILVGLTCPQFWALVSALFSCTLRYFTTVIFLTAALKMATRPPPVTTLVSKCVGTGGHFSLPLYKGYQCLNGSRPRPPETLAWPSVRSPQKRNAWRL